MFTRKKNCYQRIIHVPLVTRGTPDDSMGPCSHPRAPSLLGAPGDLAAPSRAGGPLRGQILGTCLQYGFVGETCYLTAGSHSSQHNPDVITFTFTVIPDQDDAMTHLFGRHRCHSAAAAAGVEFVCSAPLCCRFRPSCPANPTTGTSNTATDN